MFERMAPAAAACLLAVLPLFGQARIEVPKGALEDEAALAAAIPAITERIMAVHSPGDRAQHLDVLFRLQLLRGNFAEAARSLEELRAIRPAAVNVRWEIFANAKSIQAAEGKTFEEAFTRSFTDRFGTLDDKTAHQVQWTLGTAMPALQNSLQAAMAPHKGADSLAVADAIDVVRRFFALDAFRAMEPLLARLMDEDDRRRYIVVREVPVKTPAGATVCAMIVRPRTDRKLPTILNFTIYADPIKFDEARRTAANGYAAVIGLSRGKGCSPDTPVPYEHDGVDAAALIDWIAAQPWSDARVGMYGGSYEGFTAWAAARHKPTALKAIMNGAPVGPGIDVPMEGNVFWNFVYPWTFYTTNNKTLDDATYNDPPRWQGLDRNWYSSGRAYRDLEKIDGTPNPIFRTWITHPSYDAYWQRMTPQREEFARLDIPVLTTAGYYFGGPGAAVHYVSQHTRYRPHAEHYLVIGPYDHIPGHSGTVNVIGSKTVTNISGYDIEPAAHLDMWELRYRWFDYVFGRGPKPAILANKINYFVVGANKWKSAKSIAAMSGRKLHIPLTSGDGAFVDHIVDLADRSDANGVPAGGLVVGKVIDTSNGLKFVSDPIAAPMEVSGLFSGHLDFTPNVKDFDFEITLYELTPDGDYVLLAPYWTRASYNGHPSERHLLVPRKRQRLDFQASRLMSRQLRAGSRIVVVLRLLREPGRQINYGTGKDVSEETIADAKQPLRIRWFAASYVDVPVGGQ